MFDDLYTAEKIYLEQRRQVNNTKVCISLDKNYNPQIQIERLLQCLEFGDYKKEINVLNIFRDNNDDQINIQTEEPIIIDEIKTGKTIYSFILDTTDLYLTTEDLSKLTNFTQFCPNLLSLHIILKQDEQIIHKNIIKLWKNIATHLEQLREITFDIKNIMLESKSVLEITKHASNIKNLLSLTFSFDFYNMSVQDWKVVYSQFSKIKKLNTLILQTSYSYQPVNIKEKTIANTFHKKLLRLVQKNIIISPNNYIEDDYDDMGFELFG